MTPLTTIFMLSLSVLHTKKDQMQASHRRPKETPPEWCSQLVEVQQNASCRAPFTHIPATLAEQVRVRARSVAPLRPPQCLCAAFRLACGRRASSASFASKAAGEPAVRTPKGPCAWDTVTGTPHATPSPCGPVDQRARPEYHER